MASRSDYLGFHLKRDWRREGGNWREAAQEGAPSESEEGTSTGILADLQRGCGSVPGALAEPRPRAAWGWAPWGELGWCGESCPRPPSNDPTRSSSRSVLPSSPILEAGAGDGWAGGAGPWRCGGDSAPGQPPCLSATRGALASTRTPPSPACVDPVFLPRAVSSPLSCEDPVTPACPVRGNRLNGTSATTPFQMGSQVGFWEVGPQHRLRTIPPTQAPPPGPQGWGRRAGQAGAQGACCPLGSCGKGCWGHLPPPGESGLESLDTRPSVLGGLFTPPVLPRLLQGWTR